MDRPHGNSWRPGAGLWVLGAQAAACMLRCLLCASQTGLLRVAPRQRWPQEPLLSASLPAQLCCVRTQAFLSATDRAKGTSCHHIFTSQSSKAVLQESD